MPPGISSPMTMKRIQREIADLKREDMGPIVLEPNENNMSVWKGSLPGPEGSLYEGGVFDVEIILPQDYPFSAPKVVFKTRIYHMNISEQGSICIDILKQNWSPALSLFKVMLSLSSLLTDPNPKDPLVPSIATQYTRNRKQHDATARQWTQQFARPKPPPPPPPVVQAPQPPPSDKAQGKRRANDASSNPVGAGGSRSGGRSAARSSTGAAAASTVSNPVIVLDSDDESDTSTARQVPQNSRGSKRKRADGGSRAVVAGEVVDVLDSDEEQEAAAATKKARNRQSQQEPQQPEDQHSGPGSSRRPVQQLGEVIVID